MAEVLLSSVTSKITDLVIEKIVKEFLLQCGIDDDIKFIRDELSTMKAFLKDAEKRRVREEVVNQWVVQVQHEAYKVEDVLEEFLLRTTSPVEYSRRLEASNCLHFNFCNFSIHRFFKQIGARRQFHSQIEIIRKEINDMSRRRLQYNLRGEQGTNSSLEEDEETSGGDHGVSNPFVEEDDVVGIDKDVKKLQKWLLKKEEAHQRSIVSVVGMGGSGKTTLVKKVYKSVLGGEFCNAWVSVSQDFQIEVLLKQMIREFHESRQEVIPSDMETMALDKLRGTMYSYLQTKRYVLVFDDIWNLNAWEGVKHALPCKSGGRVIFTTRILDVASPIGEICYVHQVKPLSHELAWSLFCRKAFKNGDLSGCCPTHLKNIGEEMVNRCVGLPLALVVIGGLMAKKEMNELEWKDILENLDWELSNNHDLERLSRVLLTSYKNLPHNLKSCFLYCGMFPEDYQIKTSRLIRLWVAEGFIEDHPRKTPEEVAHGYLVQLIGRNMLQAANKLYTTGLVACRIHDLMRDIAIHVIKKEEFGEVFTKQSDSRTVEGQRRVTILNSSENIPSNLFGVRTRSFLTFSIDKFLSMTRLQMVLKSIKWLRVLDLSGSSIEHLPSNVVQLIHLRYLSVRGTQVNELPDSLHKLQNLQTLDARETNVESSLMYPQLRHLLFSYGGNVHLRLSTLGSSSSNLQTLGWVNIDERSISQLCHLTQLRKLLLKGVQEEYCVKLFAAVGKMHNLRTLSLSTAGSINAHEKILDLETNMSAPPLHLEKLILEGAMKEGRLPQWTCSLNCLRKCELNQNNLKEDPVSMLAHLPNLEVLMLVRNAYLGRQIGWGGTSSNEGRLNFPKLKCLGINHLLELEELSEIEEGMMPCLKSLGMIDCPKLSKLPRGFQHLKSLLKLGMRNMPEDFIKRLHNHREGEIVEGEGEDHWMIQHIPLVLHQQWSDGKLVFQDVLIQN